MKKNLPLAKILFLAAFFFLSFSCISQFVQRWATFYNGPANGRDNATAMAVDAAGNVYVTGTSQVSETNSVYATIKYNTKGDVLWIRTYNGTGNGHDHAGAIAIDTYGNVYVSGRSTDLFGNGYVTIKYDANGNELWIRRVKQPQYDSDIAFAIGVDYAGNVYVAGQRATIKYDNNGNEIWVSRNSGADNGLDLAFAMAVGADGSIYVTGSRRVIDPENENDYATIKYNSEGMQQWVARYNGPDNNWDRAYSLALDGFGNVYVTGQSQGQLADDSYATIKYNASGEQEWAARYTQGEGSYAKAIAVDASGNVYVTGEIGDSKSDDGVDFGTIKYNTHGVLQWVARYDGPDKHRDGATAIVLDAAGNVYVTGYSINIVGDKQVRDLTTIKYNTNGEQLWIARFGEKENRSGSALAIALDAVGSVYVTGYSYTDLPNSDYTTIKYSQLTGCGNKDDMVMVCHNGKPLCISTGAVAAHLKHGDEPGVCPVERVHGKKSNIDVVVRQTEEAGGLRILHYPNPVSDVANMQYMLPHYGQVAITVYDMLGKQVANIPEAIKNAGKYTVRFDASGLPKGVYYYRIVLKTDKEILTQGRKMIVVK